MNGAYGSPYPPVPGAVSPYAGLPQTRGYYCSGPPRTPYPMDSAGMYRPPSPAPPWSYVPPDGAAEGSSLRRQQAPGYSPPQVGGRAVATATATAAMAHPGHKKWFCGGPSRGSTPSVSSRRSMAPCGCCALRSLYFLFL